MATYIFQTPTVSEGPIGGHRLFMFRKANKGISIIKVNGTYSQVRYPVDSDLALYEEVYLGGRAHTGISEATKAALIAGNIGVTNTNFTGIRDKWDCIKYRHILLI